MWKPVPPSVKTSFQRAASFPDPPDGTAVSREINPNFKMVYESMQAYRETANNYRDWTGDYGFGFNRGE